MAQFNDNDFVFNGDPSGGGPGLPPVIANVNPAPGTTLGRNSPIQLDVTDVDDAIRTIILMAYWSDNSPVEVIYDGDGFVGPYALYSVKTVITNGFHFFLQRVNGWPSASVTFKPVAVDTTGSENT